MHPTFPYIKHNPLEQCKRFEILKKLTLSSSDSIVTRRYSILRSHFTQAREHENELRRKNAATPV